ncbi:MAG: SCO family protein [Deltaproteobacteria bacterium]|nr:SCO family protein [Deltaproteobacteria bacterium]
MNKLLGAVGVSALLTVVGLWLLRERLAASAQRPAEAYAEQGAKQRLEPLWPVPGFALQDQSGRTVTAQSLRGRTWVLNFIFTQCRTVCPLLTAKMVQLQRRLEGADVAFVSLSVDPEHDTPEVLAAYAQRWAPREQRWTLLATTPELLPALARDFHVLAEKGKATDPDPIIHSSVFLLVDREGMVRGAFDSELPEDFAALERGVRTLAALPAAAPLPDLPPEEQYHALACANCHERPELAPSLFGRAGTQRELDNSLRVTFDEAYVLESLLAPDAKRVRGYPLRMPGYEGQLTAAQLDALTRWILSRPAVGEQAPDAEVATDPICQMKVRVTPDALSAVIGGKTHYFCADSCRRRFVAEPSAGTGQTAAH